MPADLFPAYDPEAARRHFAEMDDFTFDHSIRPANRPPTQTGDGDHHRTHTCPRPNPR
jgi:hypothetical protein